MMSRPDIDAIQERVEKATPGEWIAYEHGGAYVQQATRGHLVIGLTPDGKPNMDDARFIAHAPTDITALIDYVAELEAVNGEAVGLLMEAEDDSRELAAVAKDEFLKHHYTQQAKAIAALLAKVEGKQC